ncbi:MAG: flagellar assembly protein T N-terminal domain-containing protein, partial [Myxococcaceae bacterium]
MSNARRSAALLVFLSLVPALAADKLPPVVAREAEGEAAIIGGNVDRASREAREAALRSAVEQVAGVIVSSQSLAVNSQLVSDQVYAHSAGYVRSYEVLSQT